MLKQKSTFSVLIIMSILILAGGLLYSKADIADDVQGGESILVTTQIVNQTAQFNFSLLGKDQLDQGTVIGEVPATIAHRTSGFIELQSHSAEGLYGSFEYTINDPSHSTFTLPLNWKPGQEPTANEICGPRLTTTDDNYEITSALSKTTKMNETHYICKVYISYLNLPPHSPPRPNPISRKDFNLIVSIANQTSDPIIFSSSEITKGELLTEEIKEVLPASSAEMTFTQAVEAQDKGYNAVFHYTVADLQLDVSLLYNILDPTTNTCFAGLPPTLNKGVTVNMQYVEGHDDPTTYRCDIILSNYSYSDENRITTCNDFAQFSHSENLTKKTMLTQDIDCENVTVNPIGNTTHPFSAIFEGNGFTIKNLKTSSGLFGFTNNAIISDVNLENAEISGGSFIGGLIAQSTKTQINNVNLTNAKISGDASVGGLIGKSASDTINQTTVDATISGSGYRVGGVIGEAALTTVSHTHAKVHVQGEADVGGLMGSALDVSVTNSHIEGEVIATDRVAGGFFGISDKSRNYQRDTLADSYTLAHVVAPACNGGLIGEIHGLLEVRRIYIAGKVEVPPSSGSYGAVFGCIKSYPDPMTFESSYWDKEKSSQFSGPGGDIDPFFGGKSTSQMYSKGTYMGWDFDNVWIANENPAGYPTLR